MVNVNVRNSVKFSHSCSQIYTVLSFSLAHPLVYNVVYVVHKCACVLQAYVYGDARRSENPESYGHQHDGRRLYTGPRVNLLTADHCPLARQA